jgi:hypothetical protein
MVWVPRVLKAKREMETRPGLGAFADSTAGQRMLEGEVVLATLGFGIQVRRTWEGQGWQPRRQDFSPSFLPARGPEPRLQQRAGGKGRQNRPIRESRGQASPDLAPPWHLVSL